MNDPTELAELLCTRLCHDLTGPISAINNGGELLEDEIEEMGSDAMALILDSAKEAANRIQFYRLAYGRVNEEFEALFSDKREVIDAFFSTTKITFDWEASQLDQPISQRLGRLLLNGLIIAQSVLIRGGTIAIVTSGDHYVIRAMGANVKADESMMEVLNGRAALGALSPKTAQWALALRFVDELQGVMKAETPKDAVFELSLQIRTSRAEESLSA